MECIKAVSKGFIINQDHCIKCGVCKKACPADAIKGKVNETLLIDSNKCIRCGICLQKCKFHAIDEAAVREESAILCKRCGLPLDLPVHQYIAYKVQKLEPIELCEDCKLVDLAEKMLSPGLKRWIKTNL